MRAASFVTPNAIRGFSKRRSPLHRNDLRNGPPNTHLQNSKNPERDEVFGLMKRKPIPISGAATRSRAIVYELARTKVKTFSTLISWPR
jgi:hypothetical protein